MKFLDVQTRFIIPFVVICLSIYMVTAKGEPVIAPREVIFENGKSISYLPMIIIHKDAYEAVKKREPISIEQKPTLIQEWNRLLLEEKQNFHEDTVKVISVYDFDGDKIHVTEPFIGEIVILLKMKRILIIQQSAHHNVSESYVLNSDGRNIVVIEHSPNVMLFGSSADDLTWWIMTNGMVAGQPFVKTCIYDYNGNKINQFENFTETTIKYIYKDLNYTIQSPQPMPPG